MKVHEIFTTIVAILLFLILKDEMFCIVENAISTDILEKAVSRFYYVLLFIVSILYVVFYSVFNLKEIFSLNIVLLLGGIYFLSVLHSLFVPFSSIAYYIMIALPILLYVFIINATFYIDDTSFFDKLFIGFFFILVFYYFKTYNVRFQFQSALTSSSAYAVLYFFPFILSVKNNLLKFVAVILTVIVVLLSYKRSGIIALGLALSIYWLIIYYIDSNNTNKRVKKFLLTMFVLFIVYNILIYDELGKENLLLIRFQNMSEDQGSGRIEVYNCTWNMIINSDMPGILLGHGWNSVLRDSSIKLSAHNDFLEVIYDFGVIVAFIYLLTLYKLIRYCINLIKNKSRFAPPFAASIVIFIINSMFSHIIIYTNYLMIYTFFWGYIYIQYNKDLECIE